MKLATGEMKDGRQGSDQPLSPPWRVLNQDVMAHGLLTSLSRPESINNITVH